jgi:hypothetical protein
MTPRPLSQGHRRAALGEKKKMKKPRPSPAGPQKNPCTQLSAHANIHGSPAQGGLKNAELPHRGGRVIEDAHDETPENENDLPAAEVSQDGRTFGLHNQIERILSVRYFTIRSTNEAWS